MAYLEGQMDGSADYRCGLNVYRTGTNASANLSTFYWETSLNMSGGSAYNNDADQFWAVNIGAAHGEGTFRLTLADRYRTSRVLANGYVDIYHDAAGFRPGFANNAYIGTSHPSVGSGGSGDVYVDAPRIPKRPSPMTITSVVAIASGTARVSFTPPTDWGGGTAQFFTVRWSEISPADTPGQYRDMQFGASTTAPGFVDVPTLTPGKRYYFLVYARNDSVDNGGLSLKSNQVAVDMPAGVYVSNGTAWVATGLQVSNGTAWVPYRPKISDGSNWVDPVDR